MRTFERIADLPTRLIGRLTPDHRLAARAQTGLAQLQELVRARALQRLRIGVGADEFHTPHAGGDHVFDSVAAATANTDDLDVGSLVERAVRSVLDHFKRSHFTPPLKIGWRTLRPPHTPCAEPAGGSGWFCARH
ncbi:hypothetical protein GALL_421490 [mine drainage metagenome]|uniref:Uncharacterized protein n=1 Tax=mine drainage metagenome TaxID=410659 RepID=A0A1J5PXG5_9ZZZZ